MGVSRASEKSKLFVEIRTAPCARFVLRGPKDAGSRHYLRGIGAEDDQIPVGSQRRRFVLISRKRLNPSRCGFRRRDKRKTDPLSGVSFQQVSWLTFEGPQSRPGTSRLEPIRQSRRMAMVQTLNHTQTIGVVYALCEADRLGVADWEG